MRGELRRYGRYCEPSFSYESKLPFVVIRTDLGISAERFEDLWAERPLLNWTESIWLNGLAGLAVLLAILIGGWRWLPFQHTANDGQRTMKFFSTLLAGLIAYLLGFID